MDINVLDFEIHPCRTKLACAIVRYGDLILRCELVYHPGDKKAWIRMPERWLNPKTKLKYCYWPNKEISDEFQKIVLNKIFDKYNLNLDSVAELHKSATRIKKCEKKE